MNPTEAPARPVRAESNRDASFGFPAGKRRVFFGPEEASQAYRIVTEAKPLAASHACNVARRHFGFTLWSNTPPLKLLTETPDEIAAH